MIEKIICLSLVFLLAGILIYITIDLVKHWNDIDIW